MGELGFLWLHYPVNRGGKNRGNRPRGFGSKVDDQRADHMARLLAAKSNGEINNYINRAEITMETLLEDDKVF